MANFSAVAYFFGREIHQAMNVPVGMIAASQEATQIEIWTPPEGLIGVPSLQSAIAGIEAAASSARKKLMENLDAMEAFRDRHLSGHFPLSTRGSAPHHLRHDIRADPVD